MVLQLYGDYHDIIVLGVLSVRRFDDILNTLSPSEQEQIKLLYEQLVENDRENQVTIINLACQTNHVIFYCIPRNVLL